MFAKIIMLFFPIAFVLSVGYFFSQFLPSASQEVVPPTPVTRTDAATATPLVSEEVADPSLALASSSLEVATTSSVDTTDPPVIPWQGGTASNVETPVLPTFLTDGVIGGGWSSNSWGIVVPKKQEKGAFEVLFRDSWAALSLYSKGISVDRFRSIEIVLGPATPLPDSLFLSLTNMNERVGALPMEPYRYQTNNGYTYRIPISDFRVYVPTITEVAIESANPQPLRVVSIKLSKEEATSRISLPSPAQPAPIEPVSPQPSQSVEQAPSQPAPLAESGKIYFNGVIGDWEVNARRGAVIDDIRDTSRSVTGSAIRVHFDKQDGSLSFTHPGGFKVSESDVLRMRILPGITDREWQQLIVTLYDQNGNRLGSTDVMTFSGNGTLRMQIWNDALIPLRHLNATGAIVKTIDIENVAVTKFIETGDNVWIDDVSILDGGY
jgi:hypothetical protein